MRIVCGVACRRYARGRLETRNTIGVRVDGQHGPDQSTVDTAKIVCRATKGGSTCSSIPSA
jgi:hypothetical protein